MICNHQPSGGDLQQPSGCVLLSLPFWSRCRGCACWNTVRENRLFLQRPEGVRAHSTERTGQKGCGGFRGVARGVSGVNKLRSIPDPELGCFGRRRETGKADKRVSFPSLLCSSRFIWTEDSDDRGSNERLQQLLVLWRHWEVSPVPSFQPPFFIVRAHIHKNLIMKDPSFVKISAVDQYNSFQRQANKDRRTLIVSACSSGKQKKNGEELSVNVNQKM